MNKNEEQNRTNNVVAKLVAGVYLCSMNLEKQTENLCMRWNAGRTRRKRWNNAMLFWTRVGWARYYAGLFPGLNLIGGVGGAQSVDEAAAVASC